MKEKKNDLPVGKTRMLPHAWKAVGFIIAAAAVATAIVATHFDAGKFLRECILSTFVIGLLIAALSKDRQEDEMLRQMRLTAFFSAFCWIALYVALYPLLAHWRHLSMPHAEAAVISMLCFYHIIFMFMKWRARREKHD